MGESSQGRRSIFSPDLPRCPRCRSSLWFPAGGAPFPPLNRSAAPAASGRPLRRRSRHPPTPPGQARPIRLHPARGSGPHLRDTDAHLLALCVCACVSGPRTHTPEPPRASVARRILKSNLIFSGMHTRSRRFRFDLVTQFLTFIGVFFATPVRHYGLFSRKINWNFVLISTIKGQQTETSAALYNPSSAVITHTQTLRCFECFFFPEETVE